MVAALPCRPAGCSRLPKGVAKGMQLCNNQETGQPKEGVVRLLAKQKTEWQADLADSTYQRSSLKLQCVQPLGAAAETQRVPADTVSAGPT